MGRRVEDVVTPELEDFVGVAAQHLPAGRRGSKPAGRSTPGAALQLEALLDWWGRVEQLRLNGDGQAGPIVGPAGAAVARRALPHAPSHHAGDGVL